MTPLEKTFTLCNNRCKHLSRDMWDSQIEMAVDVCRGLREKPAHQQPFLDDINHLPLPFLSAQPVKFTTTWLPSHSFYETARGPSCLCIPPPRGRERDSALYMYVRILCHNMCISLTNKSIFIAYPLTFTFYMASEDVMLSWQCRSESKCVLPARRISIDFNLSPVLSDFSLMHTL